MLRFLLSLLALVSGLAVPGTADARAYGPCETEIGARVEAPAEAPVAVSHAAVLSARQPSPRPLLETPVDWLAAGYAPAIPAVLIGIDRARE